VVRLGGKVSAVDSEGKQAVHIAAQLGRLDGLRAVVRAGGSVLTKDRYGSLPIHHAAQRGHAAAVALLLSLRSPASPVNDDGSTPLSLAIRHGHGCVISVLARSCPVHVDPTQDDWIPIILAARHASWDALEALLEAGAAPDAADKHGAVVGTSMQNLPGFAKAIMASRYPRAHWHRLPRVGDPWDSDAQNAVAALHGWLRALAWHKRRTSVIAYTAGGPLGEGSGGGAAGKPWWKFW